MRGTYDFSIGGFGLASDEATVSLIENKEVNLFDDLLPTDSINQSSMIQRILATLLLTGPFAKFEQLLVVQQPVDCIEILRKFNLRVQSVNSGMTRSTYIARFGKESPEQNSIVRIFHNIGRQVISQGATQYHSRLVFLAACHCFNCCRNLLLKFRPSRLRYQMMPSKPDLSFA